VSSMVRTSSATNEPSICGTKCHQYTIARWVSGR
jgi:hypothetical protein